MRIWGRVALVLLIFAMIVSSAFAGAVTIILAGQSNMVGQGRVLPQDALPGSEPIAVVTPGGLRDAREPWVAGRGTGLGRPFARTLLALDPSVTEVWLVQCAVGGTEISWWLPNAPQGYLARCVDMARKTPAAFHAPTVAVLWSQGEQDATAVKAPLYGDRLRRVVAGFRARLGSDVPFIASELAITNTAPDRDTVVQQTRATLAGLESTGFVDTADLTDTKDGVHFERAALQQIGARFAHKLADLVPQGLGQ